MSKNKQFSTIHLIILCLVLVAIGLAIFNQITKPKIAYVRTEYVIENYQEYIELTNKYDGKISEIRSTADTLEANLKLQIANFSKDSLMYTRTEKIAKKEMIRAIHMRWMMQKEALENENNALNEELYNRVVSNINEYIDGYGHSKHYDIIFGAIGDGHVMYGGTNYDVSDEIIEGLNKKYLGR